MARTGRPHKDISQTQFEKLCAWQCTEIQICDFFECCEDTLNGWCKRTYCMTFSEVFTIKRQIGLISLRTAQFRLAENSPAMAIFLGKQYLGQGDYVGCKVSVNAVINDDEDIKVSFLRF